MKRESWGSKLGFILATSGAAVGLGNIQRFPYITAQFGGAAFVLVYLLCVLLIALPLMLVEFAIGRHGQGNPVASIKAIRSSGVWKYAGYLGICTAYFILTYYLVAASWTIGYIPQMLIGEPVSHEVFAAQPFTVLFCMAIFMVPVILVVKGGLKGGIERCGKVMMPVLFVLLILLMIRSLALPNSWEGVKYFMYPDFSEIGWRAVLYALSQAFFSLCVGEAVLVTYGSYASKSEDMVTSACSIALLDTLVAIIAGFVIFPALFAFGQTPDQGVGLIFNVMPNVFLQMPYGGFLGATFFVCLAFAAFTTCIALLEMPVAYLVESRNWSRSRATWTLGILAFLLGVPSALSKGAHEGLTQLHVSFFAETGFYELMDFAWGSLGMVMGGFLLCVFTGWVWGVDNALKELRKGCHFFVAPGRVWGWIVRYIAPVAIILILMGLFIS